MHAFLRGITLLACLLNNILESSHAAAFNSYALELSQHQLTLSDELNSLHSRLKQDGGREENEYFKSHLPFHVLEELRVALDVMQSTWFEVSVGTWPTAIDWTGAVVDTHLVATARSLSKALYAARSQHLPASHATRDIEDEITEYFAYNVGPSQPLLQTDFIVSAGPARKP